MKIAEISRVSRDDAGKLIGYQRPEVKKHIQDIVAAPKWMMGAPLRERSIFRFPLRER